MDIGFQQVEREKKGILIECNDTNGLTDQDESIELSQNKELEQGTGVQAHKSGYSPERLILCYCK